MGLRLPRWRLPCLCALAELNGMRSNTAKVRAAAAMLWPFFQSEHLTRF